MNLANEIRLLEKQIALLDESLFRSVGKDLLRLFDTEVNEYYGNSEEYKRWMDLLKAKYKKDLSRLRTEQNTKQIDIEDSIKEIKDEQISK